MTATAPDRLCTIAHVALDMDGTIYKGGTLFACTLPFLQRLRALGIGYSFLTNNPSKSTADYVAHLQRLGVPATREELHTTVRATIDALRRRHPSARRLFILGTPSMLAEFSAAGFALADEQSAEAPDAVIVGFDLTLSYSRLCRACWWIQQPRIPYLATNPDRICPTDQPTVLVDCGSICAMITAATGRAPDLVLGKPDPAMLDGILARNRLRPEHVAMVGDRLYTDIRMARLARALGVLVLTGEATAADAAAAKPDDRADLVVPSLAEFGDLLEHARGLPAPV